MGMATREEAERFVEFSDMRNVRICLEHSGSADLVMEMTSDGEFRVLAEKGVAKLNAFGLRSDFK